MSPRLMRLAWTIISKSGSPRAAGKIKMPRCVRCDLLWRDFGSKCVREARGNAQWNLARSRLCRSAVAIQWTPPRENGGCNHIGVVVERQSFKPKYRWLSSLLWNQLRKLQPACGFRGNRNKCNHRSTSCRQYVLLHGSGVQRKS
jgi:hypothetical protein